MKIVSLNEKRVCVPSLKDANSLMKALIQYNSEGVIQKHDAFGEEEREGDYTLLFDDYEISIIGKPNTEVVIDWLLSLNVTDIFIKQPEQVEP